MSSQLIYKVVKEQTKNIGEKMYKLVKFLRLYLKCLFLLTVLILNLNHALQKLVINYTFCNHISSARGILLKHFLDKAIETIGANVGVTPGDGTLHRLLVERSDSDEQPGQHILRHKSHVLSKVLGCNEPTDLIL